MLREAKSGLFSLIGGQPGYGLSNDQQLPGARHRHMLTSKRKINWRTAFIVTLAVLLSLGTLTWTFSTEQTTLSSLWGGSPQRKSFTAPVHELRYVNFQFQYEHVGFNNVLQDVLMTAALAHLSWRVYVCHPVVLPPPEADAPSPRFPLEDFVGGPIIGATEPRGLRSISVEEWEVVCPPMQTTNWTVADVAEELQLGNEPEGRDKFGKWTAKLRTTVDTCIKVDYDFVFNYLLQRLGSKRLTSAWPLIQASPMLTQFTWSDKVKDIINTNAQLFPAPSRTDTFPGLLAIHLRRGDFKAHCDFLTKWSVKWEAWNMFDDFLDQQPEDRGVEVYQRTCYPNATQVVERIEQIRKEWGGLRLARIHFMTNAKPEEIDELKAALNGWFSITSSHDLVIPLGSEQLSVAVDMALAERAQVFLGNGFSSLTSNVNLIRRARGREVNSTRFWL